MLLRRLRAAFAVSAALLATTTSAINLDLTSTSSIKAACKEIAHSMMYYYTGNVPGQILSQVPGLLVYPPYFWWEGGAMFGTLIDYWYYTGDDSYNDLVIDGMMFQVGPTYDFMTQNVSQQEGNDDQAFWGMASMSAAEYKFPNPPADKPQWLALAQGVWNSQQLRWDNEYCNGGLRWQIFVFNLGYNYKNTPANAGFINLGARLFAYTGNQTYADWTIKTWDWLVGVGYIGGHLGYSVFDGAGIEANCTQIDPVQWTYSAGMLLNACAVMWNATGDQEWMDRTMGLWNASQVFFNRENIIFEAACEPYNHCDTDQLSFKAYFSRFLAASTKWMPDLAPLVRPGLAASASAAALQCSGTETGLEGNACGFRWTEGAKWDGTSGIGQQMDALEVIQSQLIDYTQHPVTAKTGGISHGNPSAGTTGDISPNAPTVLREITTADKAGAGVLTGVVLIVFLGAAWWII